MKSRRRHELKQNLLAERAGEALQKVEPYWRSIAGVVVVLATIVFVIAFVSKSRHQATQEGWTEFLAAVAERDITALSRVALDHSGHSVAPWAQHAASQAQLIEASSALYRDRAEARKKFQLAKDGFLAVLEKTNEPLLRQRALFGLAQAHEGLNELSAAQEKYQDVATRWPESGIAKQAKGRADALQKKETQEFYRWFFAQEPPAARLPAAGDTPGLPFGQPPSEPDFTLPSFPEFDDSDLDPGAPADDAPAADDAEESPLPGIRDTIDFDGLDPLNTDAPETSDEGTQDAPREEIEVEPEAGNDGPQDSTEN